MKYVSDIIRDLREKRGLSIRALALRANISHTTISRMEAGLSEPKPESLISIAKTLGVDPSVLLDAPVKGPNTVDIIDTLKDNNVEVLLGGKKLSVNDRRHMLELIQLARNLSEKD